MRLIGLNFKGAMVRSLRRTTEARKTQTRRLPTARTCLVDGAGMSQKRWDSMGFDFASAWIDEGPSPAGNTGPYLHVPSAAGTVHRIYPRACIGDQFWVRESWAFHVQALSAMREEDGPFAYAADHGSIQYRLAERWTPCIHMPLWASRIRLEITNIRFQRLQDISDADAWAEGIDVAEALSMGCTDGAARAAYSALWEEINGDGSWDQNPFILAYTFKDVSA
jgi:hypothetical protein